MKSIKAKGWVRRAVKWAGLSAALLVALSTSVWAQSSALGAIAGTVKDPSSAAVAGATVEIINQVTGVVERTVTTNSDGGFTATLLPIGVYKVIVTATGFARAEAPDIKVNVTETTSINVALKVGAVTEGITITDAATPVQTSNATTGQSLGSETVGARFGTFRRVRGGVWREPTSWMPGTHGRAAVRGSWSARAAT